MEFKTQKDLHHKWCKSLILNGTRDRTWTGTALRPRDFKSLVSTNFTTRAKGGLTLTNWANDIQRNGGASRNRTGVRGVAVRYMTTLPSRPTCIQECTSLYFLRFQLKIVHQQPSHKSVWPIESAIGAGNEIRTRDPNLGKVVLYHWAIPAKQAAII